MQYIIGINTDSTSSLGRYIFEMLSLKTILIATDSYNVQRFCVIVKILIQDQILLKFDAWKY